jgi:hypothetical protein
MPAALSVSLLALWLCLCGSAAGQAAGEEALPERPADFIRDEGRTLAPEIKVVLSQQIQQFTEKTGVQLYVDTNTFLLGAGSALHRARQLVLHWLDEDKPGMVLCVNRGASVMPVLQYNAAMQAIYPDGDLVTLSREIAVKLDETLRAEEKMPVALRTVLSRMVELHALAERRAIPMEERDWQLAGSMLAALLLLALLGHWWLRRVDVDELSDLEPQELPEVDVGQRFGAPAGGGVLVEIQY